jgi:hypothetical protein
MIYLYFVRKEKVLQDAIKDRALKMEKIDWQKCKWFQPKSLKLCMEVDFNKLVRSLIDNDFADPLKVWEKNPGEIFILDGHHRQKALEHCLENEEKKPSRMLNAIFMDCKNEKEAAKLCLIYATEYAKIQDEGLYEFLHTFNLDFNDIKMDIEFPGIDLDVFEAGYFGEPSDLDPESWDGMPEFNQQDKTAFQSIHCHFKDQKAVDDFAELVNQQITEKTKWLWIPKQDREPYGEMKQNE